MQILLLRFFHRINEAHPLLRTIFKVNCYLESKHIDKSRLAFHQTSRHYSLAKLSLEMQPAQAPFPIPRNNLETALQP